MTRTIRLIAAAGATALLAGGVLAGCGSSSDTAATPGPAVVIADKGFTESQIVASAYEQALDRAGFDASVKSLASTQVADAAVRKNDVNAYPEYTGTAYSTVLKKTDIADSATVSAALGTGYAARGLTAFSPSPYSNGNEVACTKEAVDQYDLSDLASLAKVSKDITYSANPEHVTRPDGLPLLKREYGIEFGTVTQVALNQRYSPIESGKAQCVYAFGTDPQISKLGLVVIEDPEGKFRGLPYENFLIVNTTWLEGLSSSTVGDVNAKEAFEATVNAVSAALTADAVREMNAKVDLDQQDAEVVAGEFVEQKVSQ
jgi:osmoprotectant transport system substrate-binding protein